MVDETQTMAQDVLDTSSNESRALSMDPAKVMFESTQKWFWDVANILIRGLAFYLALMAVVVGYVLTRNLSLSLLQLVLTLAFVTSILFLVGWAACVAVMFRCIGILEDLRTLFLKAPILRDRGLPDVLLASRRSVQVITAGIYIVVFSFMVAIVVLWNGFPLVSGEPGANTALQGTLRDKAAQRP
ncbi:MAG: hypothetical protein HY847_11235 [Betaproteobacteria bacterium]|nr:hypothetical protein [Betaproteobacteria bacterium]